MSAPLPVQAHTAPQSHRSSSALPNLKVVSRFASCLPERCLSSFEKRAVGHQRSVEEIHNCVDDGFKPAISSMASYTADANMAADEFRTLRGASASEALTWKGDENSDRKSGRQSSRYDLKRHARLAQRPGHSCGSRSSPERCIVAARCFGSKLCTCEALQVAHEALASRIIAGRHTEKAAARYWCRSRSPHENLRELLSMIGDAGRRICHRARKLSAD